SKVRKVRAEDGAVHLTLEAPAGEFHVAVYAPKGEKAPRQLLGSIEARGNRDFARLERTDLEKLEPNKAMGRSPAFEDYVKAVRAKDAAEKEQAAKDFLAKHPTDPLAYTVAVQLLTAEAKKGAGEADLKARAEQAVKAAATYGPEMKLQAATQVARTPDAS